MLHYYKFLFYAVNLGLGMVAIQATLVVAQDTPVGTNAFTSCLRTRKKAETNSVPVTRLYKYVLMSASLSLLFNYSTILFMCF